MKRSKGLAAIALLAVMFGVLAMPALAGGVRARGEEATSTVDPSRERGVMPGVDSAGFSDVRSYSNGVVEYTFAPPASLSPAPSSHPRPAVVVANLFLAANLDVLRILQDPADFEYLSTTRNCDGSDLVSFRQTYSFLPVETTRLDLLVDNQIVTRVSARFISDVSPLRICQPPGGPSKDAQMRVLPTTHQSVVVIITESSIDQLVRETITDSCTQEVLGWSYRYNR